MMVNCHDKGLNRQSGEVQPLLVIKVVVAALLLLWLVTSALQLAQIIAFSAPTSVEPSVEKTTPINKNSNTSSLPVDITALKAIPLFGEVVVVQEVVAEVEQEETITETQLNITLKGLFTSDNQGQGQAIIANGRNDKLYHVGESIKGLSNVKLKQVFNDRVKIDNRGTPEVLYLYPEGERIAFNKDAPSTNNNRTTSDFVEPNKPLGDSGGKTKKLNEIMRVVRERDKTTGEMLGFRVLPGRDREGFEKSGLKPNDVITSIDGEQLTDLRSAMSIYRNKRDATQVSLLIRREGSEISLDIDLSKLVI